MQGGAPEEADIDLTPFPPGSGRRNERLRAENQTSHISQRESRRDDDNRRSQGIAGLRGPNADSVPPPCSLIKFASTPIAFFNCSGIHYFEKLDSVESDSRRHSGASGRSMGQISGRLSSGNPDTHLSEHIPPEHASTHQAPLAERADPHQPSLPPVSSDYNEQGLRRKSRKQKHSRTRRRYSSSSESSDAIALLSSSDSDSQADEGRRVRRG